MDRYAFKSDFCYYAGLQEYPRFPSGPLPLHSFGYFPKKTHAVDRAVPDLVGILLITEGDGFVEIDGKRQDAQVPFVVLTLPSHRHHYGPVNSWTETYMLYAMEGDDFLNHWGLPAATPLVWPLRNFSEVSSIISTMQRICSKPNLTSSVDILDRFAETLFLLTRHGFTGSSMSSEQERILDAESYLRANFTREISVDQLAEHFGFSRTGFYRQWKTLFATSPNDLVVELRLEKARRDLIETTTSVKEISRQAGFNGAVHFGRMFRKRFLMAPAEYRGMNS